MQILRDLDELRMKNIGTFPPTRVVLSSYPRADLLIGRQRPSLKLEAGLPVGLQHDSLIHRFTAAKWVSISIELFIWLFPSWHMILLKHFFDLN